MASTWESASSGLPSSGLELVEDGETGRRRGSNASTRSSLHVKSFGFSSIGGVPVSSAAEVQDGTVPSATSSSSSSSSRLNPSTATPAQTQQPANHSSYVGFRRFSSAGNPPSALAQAHAQVLDSNALTQNIAVSNRKFASFGVVGGGGPTPLPQQSPLHHSSSASSLRNTSTLPIPFLASTGRSSSKEGASHAPPSARYRGFTVFNNSSQPTTGIGGGADSPRQSSSLSSSPLQPRYQGFGGSTGSKNVNSLLNSTDTGASKSETSQSDTEISPTQFLQPYTAIFSNTATTKSQATSPTPDDGAHLPDETTPAFDLGPKMVILQVRNSDRAGSTTPIPHQPIKFTRFGSNGNSRPNSPFIHSASLPAQPSSNIIPPPFTHSTSSGSAFSSSKDLWDTTTAATAGATASAFGNNSLGPTGGGYNSSSRRSSMATSTGRNSPNPAAQELMLQTVSPGLRQFLASIPGLEGDIILPFKLLQSYFLHHPLGEGATGFVVAGTRNSDLAEVAVKFMFKDRVPMAQGGWKRDFELGCVVPMEVFVMRRLEHDNIVRFYEVFEDSVFVYIVMEAVKHISYSGTSLSGDTPSTPPLSPLVPATQVPLRDESSDDDDNHTPATAKHAPSSRSSSPATGTTRSKSRSNSMYGKSPVASIMSTNRTNPHFAVPHPHDIGSPSFPLIVKRNSKVDLEALDELAAGEDEEDAEAVGRTGRTGFLVGDSDSDSDDDGRDRRPDILNEEDCDERSGRFDSIAVTQLEGDPAASNASEDTTPALSRSDPLGFPTLRGPRSAAINVVGGKPGREPHAHFRRRAHSKDLFDYIEKKPRMAEGVARLIFKQIAEAVAYLHARGFVHRDIKDENVIIDDNMKVKLIDFGAARHIPKNRTDYFAEFVGTLTYAPPECIALSDGTALEPQRGPEQDVWSLGVLLFVLLETRPPFPPDSTRETRSRRPVLSNPRSDVLKDLLFRMLDPIVEVRIGMSEVVAHPWLIAVTPPRPI